MTQEKLDNMAIMHKKWLEGNANGERADFTQQDVEGLDFKDHDWRGAIFKNTKYAEGKYFNRVENRVGKSTELKIE